MFGLITRLDRVRITGLLVGSVTGSTELVILGFCLGQWWGVRTIILASILVSRVVCNLGGGGLLRIRVGLTGLNGVAHMDSVSAIFAAINFNYVAARGYTVYNNSRFPITVCLLRMGFNSYRLSNDQRR